MSRSAILVRCSVATLFGAVFVASQVGAALPQRTFVASNGVDTNPCSITLPCRSFATAISKTNPTGEVIVLDSAGYGPVTITQSVAIIAPQGVYAGISVPTLMSGIVVNGSGILVKLSGLTINGQGGQSGIQFLQGDRLVVERCTVVGMTDVGLADSASSSQLYVADSTFRYSGNGGIDISAGTATIDRAHLENNGDDGVHVTGPPFATVDVLVRDSVASNNGGAGFAVTGNTSSHARLTVERSTAFQNTVHGFFGTSSGATSVQVFVTDSKALENLQNGVFATGAGATAVVTGSTLARNIQYGMVQASSSAVLTLQNNTVEQNGLNATSGTINKVSLQ
jgi:hypothetical protein